MCEAVFFFRWWKHLWVTPAPISLDRFHPDAQWWEPPMVASASIRMDLVTSALVPNDPKIDGGGLFKNKNMGGLETAKNGDWSNVTF